MGIRTFEIALKTFVEDGNQMFQYKRVKIDNEYGSINSLYLTDFKNLKALVYTNNFNLRSVALELVEIVESTE